MDYRCFRNILKIRYTDRITNIEVRNRILRAIGPHTNESERRGSYGGMNMYVATTIRCRK